MALPFDAGCSPQLEIREAGPGRDGTRAERNGEPAATRLVFISPKDPRAGSTPVSEPVVRNIPLEERNR